MAKTVYDSETIELQDGTQVTLVPLAIGLLKKFMNAWRSFENVDDEDDVLEVYIKCCGVALSKILKDKFEQPIDPKGELSDDYKEYLEDVLDLDTIFKIMEVCGGLKLRDPKLLEAATAAAEAEATA